MAAAIDFGSFDAGRITHYCCVVEGSEEHLDGKPLGTPCCASKEESIDKVGVALVNWICHRAWGQVAASRWAKVMVSLRKVLAGFLAQRVLPECLRSVQTSWGVHEGLEAALARVVAADKDDFSSRQKLRLLRVCQRMCPADAARNLAIALICMLCVEPMLYDLLGDGDAKRRATLADVCSNSLSPISKVQDRVVDRLERWGADGPPWLLLTCVGASPRDDGAALMAKAELLQMSAAIVDHFELRMSHPPYTLIRLLDPDLGKADQVRIAQGFLRAPQHCLSLFSQRLRQRCPSVKALLSRGRNVIEAWATSCFVGIDATERSHGQLRSDLRSDKRARSFTRGANRSLCQELRSAHLQGGGRDPAILDVSSLGATAASTEGASPGQSSAGRPSPQLGLNPYLLFRNEKLKSVKAFLSPQRPLTQLQLSDFEATCKREWEDMDDSEKGNWQRVYVGRNIGHGVGASAQGVVAERAEPRAFRLGVA